MNSVPAVPITAADQRRDHITGLWNENYFCRRLDRLLSQHAGRSPITLALLQLENFYEIRKWVGKAEAELLLGDIARLLQQTVPSNSQLCRCRNHEFVVLLCGNGSRRAERIGESIRQAALQVAGHAIPPQLTLACGIGFATVDQLTADTATLFARARHNLSRRQGLQLHPPSVELPAFPDTVERLGALRTALMNHSLRLVFQAVVSLDQPGRQQYELGVRLPLGERLLNAAEFMDIAVQYALGEAVDRWVLGQALTLLDSASGRALKLVANLTQNSLTSPDFMPWLEAQLASRPGIAASLSLQISEIDLLICQHHIPAFSEQLTKLNIALGVCRFGCTPNPQRYLPLLQAAFVKLDPGLQDAAEMDPAVRRQLHRLIDGIHKPEMQIVAARVETLRVVPWLWQAGVRAIQGYAIHRPAQAPDHRFTGQVVISSI